MGAPGRSAHPSDAALPSHPDETSFLRDILAGDSSAKSVPLAATDSRDPKSGGTGVLPPIISPGGSRDKPLPKDPIVLLPEPDKPADKKFDAFRPNYFDLSKRFLKAPPGWSNSISELSLDGTFSTEASATVVQYILSHPIHAKFPLATVVPVLADGPGNYILLGLAPPSEDTAAIARKEVALKSGTPFLEEDAAVYFYNSIAGVLLTVAPALPPKLEFPDDEPLPWATGYDLDGFEDTKLEIPEYEGAWRLDKQPRPSGTRDEALEADLLTRYTPAAMAMRGGLAGVISALETFGLKGLRSLDVLVADDKPGLPDPVEEEKKRRN